MIAALEKCKGIVSDAVRLVDISRKTHYEWLKTDPEYKSAVEATEDVAIDFVEGKLFHNIEDGDTTAIIFYLKTKAKKRGYIERSDVGIIVSDETVKQTRDDFMSKLKRKNDKSDGEIQGE